MPDVAGLVPLKPGEVGVAVGAGEAVAVGVGIAVGEGVTAAVGLAVIVG